MAPPGPASTVGAIVLVLLGGGGWHFWGDAGGNNGTKAQQETDALDNPAVVAAPRQLQEDVAAMVNADEADSLEEFKTCTTTRDVMWNTSLGGLSVVEFDAATQAMHTLLDPVAESFISLLSTWAMSASIGATLILLDVVLFLYCAYSCRRRRRQNQHVVNVAEAPPLAAAAKEEEEEKSEASEASGVLSNVVCRSLASDASRLASDADDTKLEVRHEEDGIGEWLNQKMAATSMPVATSYSPAPHEIDMPISTSDSPATHDIDMPATSHFPPPHEEALRGVFHRKPLMPGTETGCNGANVTFAATSSEAAGLWDEWPSERTPSPSDAQEVCMTSPDQLAEYLPLHSKRSDSAARRYRRSRSPPQVGLAGAGGA